MTAGERVGLYLRLSRDDGAEAGESMSIGNQRALLLRFAEEHSWQVEELYTDDGYSGTDFQRPGFQRLLKDIESGRINTVVTKDLSRLGRDQIGTLYYLQVYFPAKGVRFLAVGEGIDTAQGFGGGITAPFLAAANDFYTADISRKVRAALDTRRKSGLFIGAFPPLGYEKDRERKGGLIPEPRGAEIIRGIFRDYLELGSVTGVAKGLTERGVPTPLALRQGGGAGVWSDTMVRRVLTNPTYAGHLTQNRRRKVGYKVKAYETVGREGWITVPNTHEPLVSQGVFDRVQEMLEARSYRPAGGGGHLLTGLAFCGDCGAPMTYRRDGKRVYMVCRTHRAGGRLGQCGSHMIREDAVVEAVRRELKGLIEKLDREALEGLKAPAREERERQRRAIERAAEQCRRVGSRLYGDLAAGLLTEGEFTQLFGENRARREALEGQLAAWRADGEEKGGESLEEWLRLERLDRGTAAALVKRVVIGRDGDIEIQFRFKKPV